VPNIIPEVQKVLEKNEHSKIVLDNVLAEIQETLNQRNENHIIKVTLEQDAEAPRWKEIVITVQVRERDHNSKISLWEEIEEKVGAKIEQIRNKYSPKEWKIIDKITQNLSIKLEEHPRFKHIKNKIIHQSLKGETQKMAHRGIF